MVEKIARSREAWRALLSDEQYRVCRLGATERAFANAYHDCKEAGVYRCVCCATPLFSSAAKFDSGTGWPSFSAALDDARIETAVDRSLGMTRTEVSCAICDAHLGHVFPDGPSPTGLRYCINSAALALEKSQAPGAFANVIE